MTGRRLTRRAFVGGTVGLGAGVALSGAVPAGGKRKATVILSENARSVEKGKPVQHIVDQMVASALTKVTGKDNVDAAWRTIVAGSKDRVGIKFNALFPRASTSPQVVLAVVRALVHAGIAEDRITLFDNNHSDYDRLGFRHIPGLPAVRCLGAVEDGGFGPEVTVGPVTTRLAKIVTDQTDVLINLPRLKHHRLAGMTASLKNHLGSIPKRGAKALHRCIECVAELNALEPIRTKTRLCLIDALIGVFDRGPMYFPGCTWEARRLICSIDPVAADAVGHQTLLAYRATRREYRRQKALDPPVTYLKRSAAMGLGVADLAAIDIRTV